MRPRSGGYAMSHAQPSPELGTVTTPDDDRREAVSSGALQRRCSGQGHPIGAPPPESSRLSGGSDGDRLREIDVVAPPLVPFLYPERLLRARRRAGVGRYAAGAKGRRIPRERWPEVAARAEREGLRTVAREFGVSHETVRSVLRAVTRVGSAA